VTVSLPGVEHSFDSSGEPGTDPGRRTNIGGTDMEDLHIGIAIVFFLLALATLLSIAARVLAALGI